MKNKIFKACVGNLPAAVAIISFVLFSSIKQADDSSKTTAASQCCSGYRITGTGKDLTRFMQKNLRGNQFEGGVYAKQDLQDAINNYPVDSIFIMNVLVKCDTGLTQADSSIETALVITSKGSSSVSIVSRKKGYCPHCPEGACCPKAIADTMTVYAARIKRCCINYMPYESLNRPDQINTLPPSR